MNLIKLKINTKLDHIFMSNGDRKILYSRIVNNTYEY